MPDELDHFMMDHVGFVSEYTQNWPIPSHIVLFESEEKRLRDFLILHSFREVDLGICFPYYLYFYC